MTRHTNAVAALLLLSALAPAFAESPGRAIMTDEETTNYELLLELSAAFNAHDLDRIMGHFAEDSSLDMPRGNKPWGTRFTGKDAVRQGLSMRFEATPDVHYGDDRHWVSGRMGVSEWLLTGTTRDGRKVEVRGSDHYEFQRGKVIRKDSYWKIVE
jgi:ketosteroid isomerase-like protein